MQQCTNFASVAAVDAAAGDLKIKRLRNSKHLVAEHGFQIEDGKNIKPCSHFRNSNVASTGWKANNVDSFVHLGT